MTAKKSDFIMALGRRKSAVAKIRLNIKTADGMAIHVNEQDFKKYFNYFEWQDIILSPFKLVGTDKAEVHANVHGGGIKAQAEALRLAVARALISLDKELRPTLKKAGFLTRDPRVKERKKPGLKKARRAPQWSKR